MSQNNWKKPFHDLGQDLRSLLNTKHKLFHNNLMTPFHEAKQVDEVVGQLEPALDGEQLVGVIETPTSGCKHHAHYYFGNEDAFNSLRQLLGKLDVLVKRMPVGMLPEYALPSMDDPKDRNLVLWSNILYFLAWEFELWYLDADVEFQESIGVFPFDRWTNLSKPVNADPRPILTHERSAQGKFEKWPEMFQRDNCRLPDVIDSYLIDVGSNISGEFLRASVAAVGIIIGMLDTRVPSVSVKGKFEKRPRQRRKLRDRIVSEKFLIVTLLLNIHDPEANPDGWNESLTQEDIARELGWISPTTGKPLQKKVRDRLLEIFPNGGHNFYKRCLINESSWEKLRDQMNGDAVTWSK